MKVYCRYVCDLHTLDTLLSPSTLHHFVPSRQLCKKLVIEAWEQVPVSLVQKYGLWEITKDMNICKINLALIKFPK